MDDTIDAGMTSANVRPSAGDRVSQARAQPSVYHSVGNCQARVGVASPALLKLVTNRTYAGISTTIKKMISSKYRRVREVRARPERLVLCAARVGAGVASSTS